MFEFYSQCSRDDYSHGINSKTYAELEWGESVVFLHDERSRSYVGEKCTLGKPQLEDIYNIILVFLYWFDV